MDENETGFKTLPFIVVMVLIVLFFWFFAEPPVNVVNHTTAVHECKRQAQGYDNWFYYCMKEENWSGAYTEKGK